jgi:predicted TPR repeat methyltransferase
MALVARDRLDDALAHAEANLPRFPESPPLHNITGLILLRKGRAADAEPRLRNAIALDPRLAAAHNNLGALLAARGDHARAADAFREAVAIDGRYAAAHSNLGLALVHADQPEEGVAHARLACDLAPASTPVRVALAQALLDAGDVDAAIDALDVPAPGGVEPESIGLLRATALYRAGRKGDAVDAIHRVTEGHPRSLGAWRFRAHACRQLEQRAESVRAFRAILELEPRNREAAYFLDILEGRNPMRAESGYVREIFDGYADTFDRHLQDTLGYRAPEQLTALLRRVLGDDITGLDVLDVGCGTGLCGTVLRGVAGTLTGVDLSPGMIDKARARSVYDELCVADLFEFLTTQERRWDLGSVWKVTVSTEAERGQVLASGADDAVSMEGYCEEAPRSQAQPQPAGCR